MIAPPTSWRNLPWGSFLLLTVIFWFGSRADLLYSTKELVLAATLNVEGRADDWSKLVALLAVAFWSVHALLYGRRFRFQRNITHRLVLLGYAAWCFASLAWSDVPSVTMTRLIVFAVACLSAMAFAYQFSFRELTALVFFSSISLAAISLAAEIVLGTFHPLDSAFRFSGLWHPNLQAMNLSSAVFSGLALLRAERKYRPWLFALVSAAFVLLFLTRSRTMLGSTIIALVCTGFLVTSAAKRLAGSLAFGSLVCVALLLAVNADALDTERIVTLGRQDQAGEDSATLSNRVPLWVECLRYFQERPVLGYGYGAFWTPERIVAVSALPERAWAPPSVHFDDLYVEAAHNQFLEGALGTGIIGTALFAIAILGGLLLYAKRAFWTPEPWAYGFCVLLCLSLNMLLEIVPFQPFLPDLILPVLLYKVSQSEAGSKVTEENFA